MNRIKINGNTIDLDVLLAPPQDDTIVRLENGLVAMNYDTFNKLYRPKGEWEVTSTFPREWICSNCGTHYAERLTHKKHNYCAVCGADMRE